MSDKELAEFEQAMTDLIFENNLLGEEEYSEEVFDYADIVEFRIKGIWYFDSKLSELKYRPIAIAPVVQTPRSKADRKDNPGQKRPMLRYFGCFTLILAMFFIRPMPLTKRIPLVQYPLMI